jgi:hypothetical protein
MTNQIINRKSFIIHKDSLSVLKKLNNEKAGELFKAIANYQETKSLPEDNLISIVFEPFLNQFLRDEEKYRNTCEVRRIAGSKGGKQKVANASKCKQKLANLADSDSKSDSDSKKESKKESNNKKRFVPPILQDVQDYCKERNNSVDAKKFFDYYSAGDWKDAKGNQVKNWKQKLLTWEAKTDNQNTSKSNTNTHTVDFINKMIGHSLITQIIISTPNKAQIWFTNADSFKKYQNLDIDLRNEIKDKISKELNITNFEPKF